MAIPDYESLMLPVLKVASDGNEHRIGDVIQDLADAFSLTHEDRQQLLPSGKQTTFANRVHWAKTYLVQAGLLEITRRAYFRITDRGVKALGAPRIDNEFLLRFPEFIDFRSRTRDHEPVSSAVSVDLPATRSLETPDELLRVTIQQIERALGKELLNRIVTAPATFFESVIVSLLIAMGYGGSRQDAGRIVGRSGDGGIDGVIDQDALGLDRVYVQAKRYNETNHVGEPAIREFIGSLALARATKGVFVTTSSFTEPALIAAERNSSRIVLIDGEQLVALMIRHNVGVRVDETLYLKKIDEDFFADD